MVNNMPPASGDLRRIVLLVRGYVGVVAATLVALAILSVANPGQATQSAWMHMIIVAAFAILLPLRVRSAVSGSVRALRATGLIAAALLLVNAVEANLTGMFPAWMRIEMIAIAAAMAAVILLVVRIRVRTRHAISAAPSGQPAAPSGGLVK